jgi:hypothetical protein
MNKTLAMLLKVMAEAFQNHEHRIKVLEESELAEDSDDASLMGELASLLAQLQIPESEEPVPSDQM